MLIGRRWYTGKKDNRWIFEWNDDTIRHKCRQGTHRLLEALVASGYCIKLVKKRKKLGAVIVPELSIPDNVTVSGTTIAGVLKPGADKYDISPADIISQQRFRLLVLARREIIYYCYVVLGKSSTQIGRVMQRDHTTILHHIIAMRENFRGQITNPNPVVAPIHQRLVAGLQRKEHTLQTGEGVG